MKFKPFPELTDILLNIAKPLADTDKHYLEGAVYSPNLGFRRSFPRPIKSPPVLKKLKVATVAMSLW